MAIKIEFTQLSAGTEKGIKVHYLMDMSINPNCMENIFALEEMGTITKLKAGAGVQVDWKYYAGSILYNLEKEGNEYQIKFNWSDATNTIVSTNADLLTAFQKLRGLIPLV